MDYEEERSNELIALDSIYENEMTLLSSLDDPLAEFTILVKYSECGNERTEDPPTVVLRFKYTQQYPDEVPLITIEDPQYIAEEDLPILEEHLRRAAEKNLGTVMVYTLVLETQEWLNTYKDNMVKMAALASAKNSKVLAELERKKFEGTIVTPENFSAWRKKFESQQKPDKRISSVEDEKSRRLTGRELFVKDKTLASSDLKFLEEDGEQVKVDETLFEHVHQLNIETH